MRFLSVSLVFLSRLDCGALPPHTQSEVKIAIRTGAQMEPDIFLILF